MTAASQAHRTTTRNAVCLCADGNMLVPALFVAWSVKQRAGEGSVPCDVIVVTLPDAADIATRDWMRERGIALCDTLDLSAVAGLEIVEKRLTFFTLVKLLLPGHFAGQYGKILYLDADLTIHGDPGAAFALDLGAYALAASLVRRVEGGMRRSDLEWRANHFRNLGLTAPVRYFNAGVMLIDVANWNAAGLTRRALEYFHSHPEFCLLADEDSLNAVMDGNIAILSPIWNVQMQVLRGRRGIPTPFMRPVIRHYAGPAKPWRRFASGKLFFSDWRELREYRSFLRGSPWPNWLRTQWSWSDVRKTIEHEIQGLRRLFNPRGNWPPAERRRLYAASLEKFCREEVFIDVAQGVSVWREGVLELAPPWATRSP